MLSRLDELSQKLQHAGYEVQTLRICTSAASIGELDQAFARKDLFLCAGTLSREAAQEQLPDFLQAGNTSFNLGIPGEVKSGDVEILHRIIENAPAKTFQFSYTFVNPGNTPFYPSAHAVQNGFAVGMQPTDLSKGCLNLSLWLERMKACWQELTELLAPEPGFLGIDTSVAPLGEGHGSLIHFLERLGYPLGKAVTTDLFTRISNFLKTANPRPVGLCGLMFPCLEDTGLADAYEKGEFPIERNLFLSLHSGVGIDTYPIGIDESPERIRQILNLLGALSYKYQKPLAARFISDGKAKVGEMTDFQNPYLQDVVLRPL